MFHEVRVLNARKHLKKIIPEKELSRRHWEEFDKKHADVTSSKNRKNKQLKN